jgi:hypothetical protein
MISSSISWCPSVDISMIYILIDYGLFIEIKIECNEKILLRLHVKEYVQQMNFHVHKPYEDMFDYDDHVYLN